MDRDLIETKLESLRRCVERVAAKTPSTAEELALDADVQDVIALNLQRAVLLCVDIASHIIAETEAHPPDTMAPHFEVLAQLKIINSELAERLIKAVGFRNIVVHSYQNIDWRIVFQICTRHLADFKQFAQGCH